MKFCTVDRTIYNFKLMRSKSINVCRVHTYICCKNKSFEIWQFHLFNLSLYKN